MIPSRLQVANIFSTIGQHRNLPYVVTASAILITLVIAGTMMIFAHPLADDFCRAGVVREVGLLKGVGSEFLGWTGRWTATGLSGAVSVVVGLTSWYGLCLLIITVACSVAIHFFLITVFGLEARSPVGWFLTLGLVALYWTGMSHPGETVYWLTGAYENYLSVALSLVLVACLLRLPEQPTMWYRLGVIGLALLAVLIEGLHELFGIMLCVVLLAGTSVAFWVGDPRRYAWLTTTVAALVGFLIVYMAPGNDIRQAADGPGGQNLTLAVDLTIRQGVSAFEAWVMDAKLLTATVLFVTLAPVRVLKPGWLPVAPVLWKRILPIVWLIVLVGGFFGPSWALGDRMPPRTQNGLYMVFLLGWFLTVFVYTRWEVNEAAQDNPPVRLLTMTSAVVFAVGLLISTNLRDAASDLARGTAPAFDRHMQHRYRQARRAGAKGQTELVVAPVESWPRSYFKAELEPDPDHWRNDCFAGYFAIKSVRVNHPKEPLIAEKSDR